MPFKFNPLTGKLDLSAGGPQDYLTLIDHTSPDIPVPPVGQGTIWLEDATNKPFYKDSDGNNFPLIQSLSDVLGTGADNTGLSITGDNVANLDSGKTFLSYANSGSPLNTIVSDGNGNPQLNAYNRSSHILNGQLIWDNEANPQFNGNTFTVNSFRMIGVTGPTFSGSGLDDFVVGGTFSGGTGYELTTTIVGTSGFGVAYSGEIGLGFQVNDVITQTDGPGAGTHGTLVQINGGAVLVLKDVVSVGTGFDGMGFHLSNGTGTTADEGNVLVTDNDIFTWTDNIGGNPGNLVYFVSNSLSDIAHGITGAWGALNGHTVNDSWLTVYTVSFSPSISTDGFSRTVSLGDTAGSLNSTKYVLDDTNQTHTFNGTRTEIHTGVALAELIVTADGAIRPYTYYVDVDTSSSAIRISLPDATTVPNGTTFVITDASGIASINNIQVDVFAASGQTIQGLSNILITNDWGSLTLHSVLSPTAGVPDSWIVT